MSCLIIEKKIFFQLKIITLLVLNNETIHKTIKVKVKRKEWEAALSVIPNSLTWKLQLLDISINKLFKERLRNNHLGFLIERKKSKSAITEWIDELWYRIRRCLVPPKRPTFAQNREGD